MLRCPGPASPRPGSRVRCCPPGRPGSQMPRARLSHAINKTHPNSEPKPKNHHFTPGRPGSRMPHAAACPPSRSAPPRWGSGPRSGRCLQGSGERGTVGWRKGRQSTSASGPASQCSRRRAAGSHCSPYRQRPASRRSESRGPRPHSRTRSSPLSASASSTACSHSASSWPVSLSAATKEPQFKGRGWNVACARETPVSAARHE